MSPCVTVPLLFSLFVARECAHRTVAQQMTIPACYLRNVLASRWLAMDVMSQYDRHDRAWRLRISSQCSALYRLTRKSINLNILSY
jgi:hypothetical protein